MLPSALPAGARSSSTSTTVSAGLSSRRSAASTTGAIVINGVTTATFSTTTDAAVSRTAVVQAINSIADRTGIKAVDTGLDTAGVQLQAADGRNITVSFNTLTSAATGIMAAGTNYGTVSLTSDKAIKIDGGTTNALGTNAGFSAGTYEAQVAKAATITNNGIIAAVATVTVRNDATGASMGVYTTSSIATNQTLQISAKDIETGAGITSAAGVNYTLSISGAFSGYAQHIIFNPATGQLADLSSFRNRGGAGVTTP